MLLDVGIAKCAEVLAAPQRGEQPDKRRRLQPHLSLTANADDDPLLDFQYWIMSGRLAPFFLSLAQQYNLPCFCDTGLRDPRIHREP